MPLLDRDGVHIRYDAIGSGPPLLLTHGFSSSSHMFAETGAALAAANTVITWDVRGHGRSDSPDDQVAYSAERSVGDMVAVLDACGVQRAVLAGHSLGGFLSLSFHLAHPERVAGLVLIDTGPGYRRDEAREGWNAMAERFARDFEQRGLDALGDSDEVRADVHRGAGGLVRAARGILTQRGSQVLDSLPGISVPTLVVVGEHDAPFLDGSRYMASKIPGARLEIIPNAAHAPNIDNPTEVERVLTEFLAQVPGR